MRIQDNSMAGVGASGLDKTQAAETQQRQTTGTGGAGKTGSSDAVSLSSLAGKVQAEDVNSPEREARLATLAASFAAGTYQPNLDVVSGAMIDEAVGETGAAGSQG
jgi:anti-sigma28 factor (negative regulator of flagellin synthesis)